MKKKLLATLLSLTMLATLLPTAAFAAGGTLSGSGTETDPYLIEDADDLAAFRDAVNDGESDYAGQYVRLAADITLSGEWTPIGNGTRDGSGYTGNAFKGTFDGNDKTISGLTVGSIGADNGAGLFGIVDGGTVMDLPLSGVSIDTDSKNAGAAVGLLVNGATVSNVTVSGSVKAPDGAGGIVGRMAISGTIENCTNNAAVEATSTCAGGIVGKAYYTAEGSEMTISGCTNAGEVTGDYAAGGIAGLSAANISGCENDAAIKAGTEAGGIVGEQTMYGIISGNTNRGEIKNNETGGTAYGGIVGWARYANSTDDYPLHDTIVIKDNTNSGNISASSASLGTGGIVGSVYNQATITGNSNTADSIIGGTFSAGIAGGLQPADNNLSIQDATITVANNVSTTAKDNISGTCVAEAAYNNDSNRFVVENNSDAWAAEIDDTVYASLQAAVDAAEDGDTITLVKDCAEDVTVAQAAGVEITIDGANKNFTGTITVDGKSSAYDTAALTIENVKFDATGISTDACINLGVSGNNNTRYTSNVTVKDCTFTGANQAKVAIKSYTGGDKNLTITGCTVDDTMHSLLQAVNITGVVIDGCDVKSKNGINLNSSSDVEIKNSTISVSGYAVRIGVNGGTSGEVTMTNNTLKTDNSEGDAVIVLRASAVDADITMLDNVVSGATHISGTTDNTTVSADKNYWDGESAPMVDGTAVTIGSYYKDAELTELVTISSGAVNTVVAINQRGARYLTLADAFAGAASGDIVTLIANINEMEETATVPAGKTLTLDLNGKTITGTDPNTSGNFSLIDNKGTLTIKDGSAGDSGKITLTATTDRDWNASSTVVTNSPGGKLTIESGTIQHLGGADMAYGVDSLTNGGIGDATVTIRGGTILSTYRGVRQFANSATKINALTITGGTISGDNRAVWLQSANVNANIGSLTISGGEVGSVYVWAPSSGNASALTMGAASANVEEVVDGLTSTDYGVVLTDGTYGIAPIAVDVTGVALDKTTASLKVGNTTTLTATIAPADATINNVTWSSSDEAIATVDSTGKVTAVAVGSATITAKAGDKTATCAVTVTTASSGGSGSSKYAITVEDADNGTVTVSPKFASKGSTVTITVDPDDGYELDELTVLDKNGDEVTVTKKSAGKYTFKMPSGKVTVEAAFVESSDENENPFTDVVKSDYYYDAVLWACDNGITCGTSDTTFSPNAICTRAQTVTFLWRAAGSPEPKTTVCPFEDVAESAYYYDAVLWAVENDITAGTSGTTFSPDATVTRAQNVTFLWRWAGSPEAETGNTFSDVAADAYYCKAVTWAAEEGITSGTTASTFSPDAPCLRSQIVTFLYRFLEQ